MEIVADKKEKLLEILAKVAPDSSKTRLRSWVREGRVFIDGTAATATNIDVEKGSQIQVGKKVKFLDEGVEVLYEDRDVVVINKPEGLLSVATDDGRAISVHEILKNRYYTQPVYPVHRLDRDTSGPLVFAYTQEAREHLQKQFHDHTIDRHYIAIVEGEFKSLKGTWESYLVEDRTLMMLSTTDETKGKKAITHYRLFKVAPNFSMLKIRLETGRRNQIRVHCSDNGHPVAGDKKYGGHKSRLGRLGLHAEHLAFTHPRTSKRMEFNVEAPTSFISLF
jgi:23S rRNA pseudouridine1911/1915/1917 synthase